MKHNFRVIIDEPMPGSLNMGIDRAIVQSVSEGESASTLRLYSWIKPAVTVGYFQKVSETVNTLFCRDNNIPVIRRITGGGTVLHNKEITYSFITPLINSPVPSQIESSFIAIINPVIASLKSIGIDACFKPINDIVACGKKISGSAQTRKHGVLLQHGTILTEIDRDIFEGALKFDQDKLREKGVSESVDLVTSVKNILGSEYTQNTAGIIIESIINNYSESLQLNIKEGRLSDEELLNGERSMKEVFENSEWNYKR